MLTPRPAEIEAARKHTLIMMVGLPYSGKTTTALTLGVPIVSPDAIRYALHGHRFIGEAEDHVWAIAKTMVGSLFIAGHDKVVLDATNVTKKRRENWRSKKWGREFLVADAPAVECIARAARNADTEIIPVIERMLNEWEPISPDELI